MIPNSIITRNLKYLLKVPYDDENVCDMGPLKDLFSLIGGILFKYTPTPKNVFCFLFLILAQDSENM